MAVFLFYICALLALFTLLAGIAELWEWLICTGCTRYRIDPYCPVHGWKAEADTSLEDAPPHGEKVV
jgi:hypothetical protein